MKRLIVLSALLVTAAAAQDNFVAMGVSWSPGAAPALAGTGIYARKLLGVLYAFTVVDVLPTQTRPLTVTTQFSTGMAQRVLTVGRVQLYVPTAAGISYTGSATGWAWSTGGLAVIRVGAGKAVLAPALRVTKSSVSNGTGYQVIAGINFGWGGF